jgi:hypothetical protein
MAEIGRTAGGFDFREGLGHAGKAQRMKMIEGWMGQQGVFS